MNIKEVSERLKIPKETLRYWENNGLIPKVPRNSSGYRTILKTKLSGRFLLKQCEVLECRSSP